jgi:hypothetical protein
MVSNRATTLADGNWFSSCGQVYLTAVINGQEVFANKYSIGFKQSGPSQYPMQLWYGSTANSDSVTNWTRPGTSTPGTFVSATDSNYQKKHNTAFYIFDSCTTFKFVNGDVISSFAGPTTPVKVFYPDNSFNNKNTQCFFVIPDINSVALIGGLINATDNSFTSGSEVPIGHNYKIVAITNKNGSYYYWEASGVVASGVTVHATLSPETRGDIIARLKGL